MPCVEPDPQHTDHSRPRRWRRVVRDALTGLFVFCGLAGGGASVGYFVGVYQARADHLAELERLQQSHKAALEAITGQVREAATTVTEAASTVTDVASTVDAAVQRADGAAAAAKSAAQNANKAASRPIVPSATVNQEIREANKRIGK